jgi:hypothetical protein
VFFIIIVFHQLRIIAWDPRGTMSKNIFILHFID